MTPITQTLSAIQVPGNADLDATLIKLNDGKPFKIIGYITKDEISFDCEPYVERLAVGLFRNYNHESPKLTR